MVLYSIIDKSPTNRLWNLEFDEYYPLNLFISVQLFLSLKGIVYKYTFPFLLIFHNLYFTLTYISQFIWSDINWLVLDQTFGLVRIKTIKAALSDTAYYPIIKDRVKSLGIRSRIFRSSLPAILPQSPRPSEFALCMRSRGILSRILLSRSSFFRPPKAPER